MSLNDLILISIDDHVIEPPDTFKRHMPRQYASRAPFVESINGADHWNVDGRRFVLAGLNAVAGRPREEYGIEPIAFSQLRPGAYDIAARLDDMNANGVLGSMCFPSVMGFGGGMTQSIEDRGYALAIVRAYNDWHVHEWAGNAPGRIIPLAVLPMWDVPAAVAEVERLAGLGVHAVTVPSNPAFDGTMPSVHSDHWDPLWKACSDHGVVVCCHIGTSEQPPYMSMDEPADAWMVCIPMATAYPTVDWLFSPVFKKFPSLRVALSEAGIGWVPHMLERADFIYEHHGAWTHSDFGGELPSDVFRRHFITCFIDDKYGLKNRDEIGLNHITWECDYPHSDSTWPNSPEILWESLKTLPAEDIALITHKNAMREFHYDPFSVLPVDQCTVGALRRKAAHVNTGATPGLGGRKPGSGLKQVTVGEMLAELSRQKVGEAA
jgi:predicted TIM-barrel fold metal-dependent hydrolase